MQDFQLAISRDRSVYVVTAGQEEASVCVPVGAPPSLAPEECGRWLFQRFFVGTILAAYQLCMPVRLLLTVADELLAWPWRWLHDGFQFLALYHPVLVFAAAGSGARSELLVEREPVRILLTGVAELRGGRGAASCDEEERVLRAFAERHADRVELQVQRGKLEARTLADIFRETSKPLHIWQHSGFWHADLTLKLSDTTLQVESLRYLLSLRPELRCLILHSRTSVPSASALRTLNLPFVLSLAPTAAPGESLALLELFYGRLLTHDLAIAGTLAQLTFYLAHRESPAWSSLSLLAATPALYLVAHRERRAAFPVSVLILKANPLRLENQQQMELLRIEREVREIKRIAREHRNCFLVHDYGATRPRDLADYLLLHTPHILQFSGHAFRSGALAFERERGETARVDFASFAHLLARCEPPPRCVVLNACYTLPLAELLVQYCECVIGMYEAIGEEAAENFSRAFYQALAYGQSVGAAFRWACGEIDLGEGERAGWRPQLLCRSDVNPDEIVLVSPPDTSPI